MRAFLAALATTSCLLAVDYQCSFAAGAWQASDWAMVKSPRWPHCGEWVQEKDGIRNRTPADATQADMLGRRAGETYTSMLLKQSVEGNAELTATLSFEHRMAPLIVLAAPLGTDEQGHPEYREHWEIVVFDEGVNVWHHRYDNGKPSWQRVAYARFAVAANKRHRLQVVLKRAAQGAQVDIRVGGHQFGYLDASLPASLQVGITACEGVNRFHDFRVKATK